MKKRNKILAFSGVIVAFAVFAVYMIFSENTVCKEIKVDIVNDSTALIIDKEDVEKIILSKYEKLIGASIDIVDLALLESSCSRSLATLATRRRHGAGQLCFTIPAGGMPVRLFDSLIF